MPSAVYDGEIISRSERTRNKFVFIAVVIAMMGTALVKTQRTAAFRLYKRQIWLASAAVAASAPVAQLSAQSANQIITQPARDVGLQKTEVPPLLVEVGKNPYSTKGTASCAQISGSISALTKVIGPDFSTSPAVNKRNLAQIGGTAVVNSLIPFRGIIREVSGASAAQRRKSAAIDAGIARRGFLRGLASAGKCRV